MSLKKKLTLAVLTTTLGASIMAAGSFALFSANAANSGNTFTSGTVKIADVTGVAVASTMDYFNNLAPGDTSTKNVTIKNTGNLDAWIRVDDVATQATRTGALFNGSKPLVVSYNTTPVRVNSGQSTNIPITYRMPLDADDSYQNATGSINIVFDAVQVRNNSNADFSAPTYMPTTTPFIANQDFNVTAGHTWTNVVSGNTYNYSGYSVGFGLAKSPKDAGVTSIIVDFYKDNTLLQENKAITDMLNYTGTNISSPAESDSTSPRFTDTYWTYSPWYGSSTDKPTKAVIKITTSDGHTYTQEANAY